MQLSIFKLIIKLTGHPVRRLACYYQEHNSPENEAGQGGCDHPAKCQEYCPFKGQPEVVKS